MTEMLLQDANRLRRSGKLAEAAELYGRVLTANPAHFEALHALGLISYQGGRLEEAERLIARAVSVNPQSPDAAYNHACLLQRLNRPEEALQSFDRALAARPAYLEALVNRGGVLMGLKRYEEALANSEQVVALKPDLAEVWNNHAGVLLILQRLDEALSAADHALVLKPEYVQAWKNKAAILTGLRRYEEGISAVDKALKFAPNDLESLARRADLLAFAGRPEESAAAHERYLQLKPGDANAWHARGYQFKLLNRRAEALDCFEKAAALSPGDLAILESRANMAFELEHWEDAARDYEVLAAGDAPPSWLPGYLAMCHLHTCDWRALDDERAAISASLEAGKFVIDPTGCAVITRSPAEQLQCARIWAADKYPPQPLRLWNGERYGHEKIRVAYLSADFRAHATAFLMAGVFEHHDRSRFETAAITYSSDDRSPMRSRLQAAFGRFIDVRDKTDEQVARLMREMEIDIAVDLNGYTGDARTGILALRPAPVQVNYLGYPGTMGAPFIDYIIGDHTVIPDGHAVHYSEKVAYLPHAYQANDRKRRVAERTPTRAEAGLPEKGFVFSCFNNTHKIGPEMFAIWMRLLRDVEGSVLWLLADNPLCAENLKREAAIFGMAPERLIFAPRVMPDEHLARVPLGDLFLDTLPYNAHTTASDAFWMGLPLVTCPGETFPARVAASLLKAIGLPELIAPTLADYEEMARTLAQAPERLAAIRAKLVKNRDTEPMFDTPRFTRYLEAAYTGMHERHQAGRPPESFSVPADI